MYVEAFVNGKPTKAMVGHKCHIKIYHFGRGKEARVLSIQERWMAKEINSTTNPLQI